jgi:hypothetical protein
MENGDKLWKTCAYSAFLLFLTPIDHHSISTQRSRSQHRNQNYVRVGYASPQNRKGKEHHE